MSSEEEVSSQQLNGGRKPIKKGKKGTSKVHKMISSTYQKQKCDFYNRGSCNKGSHCTFSHSFVPDVAKKICKFFLSNSCSKGSGCSYSHNTKRYPCKFFHIQNSCLQAEECRFSHDPIDQEFQQQFLKDNQDFLVKLIKQDWKMSDRHIEYVRQNDLMNKQNRQENEDEGNSNLPFMFGMQILTTPKKVMKENVILEQKMPERQVSRDPRLNLMPIKKKIQVKEDPRLKFRQDQQTIADKKQQSYKLITTIKVHSQPVQLVIQEQEKQPLSSRQEIYRRITEYMKSYY